MKTICEVCQIEARVIINRFGKYICLDCLIKKYPAEAERFIAQFKEKINEQAI